jgi:hypothetical protein
MCESVEISTRGNRGCVCRKQRFVEIPAALRIKGGEWVPRKDFLCASTGLIVALPVWLA